MILADTSVWIAHLRSDNEELAVALGEGRVLTHSMIRGELAMGAMASRKRVLDDLASLPHALRATDIEVLTMIDRHALHGRGLNFVDVHLLTSAVVTPDARIWTLDRRLSEAAGEFGVVWPAA